MQNLTLNVQELSVEDQRNTEGGIVPILQGLAILALLAVDYHDRTCVECNPNNAK